MAPVEILPHKYPFIFADKILEFENGGKVVCLKNITTNEEFFGGGIAKSQSIPNVFLIEAMSQTAGFLLSSGINMPSKQAFMAGIRNACFKNPAAIGDALTVTAILLTSFLPFHIFNVNIAVNGNIIAEAEIILSDAGAENEQDRN